MKPSYPVLPYLTADELCTLFMYKSKRELYSAIRYGRLPVATYKLGGRIVADRKVVRAFFQKMQDQGFKETEALSNRTNRRPQKQGQQNRT